MSKNRLVSLALTVSVLMMVLVAACSSASPSPSPSAVSTPRAVSPAPTAAAAPAPTAATGLVSTSGSASDEQAYQKAKANWPNVVAAAQKEGTATIYTQTQGNIIAAVEGAFNKIDPKIQIKLVNMSPAAAIERLKAEAYTKQYIGNGFMAGSLTTRTVAKEGLAQAIDDLPVLYEPGVKWIVSPLLDKPYPTLSLYLNSLYFLVNTKLAPEGQEPKTWQDLADPKWKDKILLLDPRLPSAGQAIVSTLYASPDFGPDYVKKLLNNARVTSDPTQAQLVARGEYVVTFCAYGSYDAVKDAPVKLYQPEDGLYASPVQMAAVKNAPQLDVTKVFLNWILSKEGQQVMSAYYTTIRPDVDPVNKFIQVSSTTNFLKGAPPTVDFDLNMDSIVAKFKPWLDEQGK